MSTDSDKTTDQRKLNPEWVKAGPKADLSFVMPDTNEKAAMVYGANMLVRTMEKYKELLEENTKLKKELAVCHENIAWVLKYVSEEPYDINAGHVRWILDANKKGGVES
jgi:hypothetical protein